MKYWIIAAAVLIVVGIASVLLAMESCDWDFRKLDTAKYQTVTHELNQEVLHISVRSTTADVLVAPSEDGKARVVCTEHKKIKHAVTETDGQLTVSVVDERAWYDHIQLFSFTTPKITVYLPMTEYGTLSVEGSTGDVKISDGFSFESIGVKASSGDVFCGASSADTLTVHVSTGDVRLNDTTARAITLSTSTGDISLSRVTSTGNIQIDVSTGDVEMTDVRCQSLSSTGSTGDVELENVIATESIRLERSTGDVELDRCDAAEVFIETNTGDVEGSLLSPKIFFTKSSTGDVNVPHSTTGGTCEIHTSTGDISFTVR